MGLAWTIRGPDGSRFITKVKLSPRTRWGQLHFHLFWRGDTDPDPHDHPWDFWTFPLRSYVEEVPTGPHAVWLSVVGRFRWHHRPAEHIHRVVRSVVTREGQVRRFATIVWTGPKRRGWGFWPVDPETGERYWIYWRDYLGEYE